MAPPRSELRPRLDRGAAVLGLLVVLAANGRYLAGLTRVADPGISLEPFYIELAAQPLARIFADPAWGPLYALWLVPLRALFADPLTVYTANLLALSVALSTAVFVYVLLLTRGAAVAVAAALFFVISDLNVPLPSPVYRFALLVVIAGLAASELVRPGARRAAVVALGALAASYVRPELYPPAFLLLAWSGWLARGEARSGRTVLLWPAAVVAALLGVALAVGVPLRGEGAAGQRLTSAFREHFAWNWYAWNDVGTPYADVWSRVFGDADDFGAALRANPAAVARHVGANAVGSARFLMTKSFAHTPLLAPATQPSLVAAENLAVAAAGFVCLLAIALHADARRRWRQRYGHVAAPYLILAAFPLFAAIVVYPKVHYLAVTCALVVLASILCATVLLPAVDRDTRWRRAGAALLAVALVPTPFADAAAGRLSGGGGVRIERPVTDAVARIRALELSPPVQVLTFTDGIGALLGDGFVEHKVWQRGDEAFDSYLRSRAIDVIVTMERGRKSFFVDDPLWERIQLAPGETDFTPLQAGADDAVRIWVRRSRLHGAETRSP